MLPDNGGTRGTRFSQRFIFVYALSSSNWLHKMHRPFAMAALSDDPVQEWILSEGKATQITRICPIGGGCINLANRYDTDASSFFVKTNRNIGPSMFKAEAIGLDAMYETGTICVPKPFKVGPLQNGGSYIIMEFIEFGASQSNQSVLGRKLAEMHKAGKSEKGFGFPVNNTIGSIDGIEEFKMLYGEHRLGYELKLAQDQYGDSTFYQRDGHNEAEFGMSWCTGFGESFYSSYFEVMPKQPGFEKRRDLYLLYHYLNHYNLFGSGYHSSAISIIDDYLRMLNV